MPRISHFQKLRQFDVDFLANLPRGTLLIGLDEVGRGSLIDSVVAGAVCIPASLNAEQKECLKYLNDSKKLDPELRASLSNHIHSFCHTGLGSASQEEVESLNVYHASVLALERAAQQLLQKMGIHLNKPASLKVSFISPIPSWFLVLDGKALLPGFHRECQQAIIKGDGQSAAIAAASVIAKHSRDTHVKELAKRYPGYGWESNMGYATSAHQSAIETLGITPLHRRHFKTVRTRAEI